MSPPSIQDAPHAVQDSVNRASTQPDRLTRRVLAVCESVGQFIEYWGFKAIHGRVWALLALRAGPLSQTEMAEILGVSRSLVSTTIAELVDYGLVRPTSDRRNAPYEANLDVWPTISDILRSREWMLLESARVALEAAVDELECADPLDESRWQLDRMKMLLTMTEMAQSLLKLLFAIRRPQSIITPLEGVGGWVARAAMLVKKMRAPRVA